MKRGKFLLLLIMIVISAITGYAQQSKTQTTYPVSDSLAGKMCACILSTKDTLNTIDQFIKVASDCVQKYAVPRMGELLKEDGFIDTGNEKARADRVQIIGKKMGQKVMAECEGIKPVIQRIQSSMNKQAGN